MSAPVSASMASSPTPVKSDEKKSTPEQASPSATYGASSIQSAAPASGMVMIDAAALAQLMAAAAATTAAKPQTPESITLANGNKYSGELKDGVPHGKGRIDYARGDSVGRKFYQGEFQMGQLHGKGYLSWMNGQTFDGFFENNLAVEGTWSNGIGDYIKSGTFDKNFKLIKGMEKTLWESGWRTKYFVDGQFSRDGKTVSTCVIL